MTVFWSQYAEFGTRHKLGKIGDGIRLCKFPFSCVQNSFAIQCSLCFSFPEGFMICSLVVTSNKWHCCQSAGSSINPDLFLAIFLPVLLFESAFSMEVHLIKVCFCYLLVQLHYYHVILVGSVGYLVVPRSREALFFPISQSEATFRHSILSPVETFFRIQCFLIAQISCTWNVMLGLHNNIQKCILLNISNKFQ